jgi:hypothetical protein
MAEYESDLLATPERYQHAAAGRGYSAGLGWQIVEGS